MSTPAREATAPNRPAVRPATTVTEGVFELRAVPVGTLPVPAWAAVFAANDTKLVDLGFYVWVVTDGHTVGLVDLGLPPDPAEAAALDEANRALDRDGGFRDVRLVPDVLTELGLSGDDIDFIAITQTVTYHTGGLDAGLFPRAHVYISLAGVGELLTGPSGHPPAPFFFTPMSWSALRQLAVEGRLHCVDAPTEIVPGVVFETTGGHHPGSAGLRIRTQAGMTGLLETAFLQENLERRQPIGICEDVSRCRTVIHRYLQECDEVVAIHEPSNASRFPAVGRRTLSSTRSNEPSPR